jgi:anti-sigma B factor antagonist
MSAPEVGTDTVAWAIVPLDGEIDLSSAPAARAKIGRVTHSQPAFVILDLSRLDFVDSTGLGVFVGALRRIRAEGGELRLAGATPSIRRVFGVTGLDRVFDLFPTVEAATEAPAS